LKWLARRRLAHLAKLVAVSRAWTNIVRAAYPRERVRWRTLFGAYVCWQTGVNAIIPARGGDVVRLFLAKRGVEHATYTTLVSRHSCSTLFDFGLAGCFVVWALTQHVLPRHQRPQSPSLPSLDSAGRSGTDRA
jgi:hypothetical protein